MNWLTCTKEHHERQQHHRGVLTDRTRPVYHADLGPWAHPPNLRS